MSAPAERFALTPQESLNWRLHGMFDGDASGACVLSIAGLVERTPLRAALRCLQERHPKLRADIVEQEDGALYFALPPEFSAIPCEVDDHDGDLPDWTGPALALLRAGCGDGSGPLMRVRLVRSHAQRRSLLALMLPHVVYDGPSIVRVVQDLLDYYAACASGGPAVVESLPLKSVARVRVRGGWPGRARAFFGLLRRQRSVRRRRWTSLPVGSEKSTRIVKRCLSEHQTLAFVRACRREHASVYGALMAAAARAVATTLVPAPVRLRCTTPVSIRDDAEVDLSAADLGCFLSICNEFFDVDSTTALWPFARRAQAALDAARRGGLPQLAYNLTALVKKIPPPTDFKRTTLTVDSAGLIATKPRYGSLVVDEIVAIPKFEHIGSALLVSSTVTARRMTVVVMGSDLEEADWNALCAHLFEAIDGIVAAAA